MLLQKSVNSHINGLQFVYETDGDEGDFDTKLWPLVAYFEPSVDHPNGQSGSYTLYPGEEWVHAHGSYLYFVVVDYSTLEMSIVRLTV